MGALANKRHEVFAQGLFAGKSQRQAYREAYPSAETLKDATVDSKACLLAKEQSVLSRLTELHEASVNAIIEERQAQMIALSEIVLDESLSDEERFTALEALIKMDFNWEGSLHDITTKDVAINCIGVMLNPDVKPIQKRAAYLLLAATYSRKIVNDALVPYAAVLSRRDPLVYKWKTVVTKRDKVCQICGSTEHLEVHHKSAWAEDPINRVNPENGILLCSDCHAKQHPELSPRWFHRVRTSV